MHGYQGLLELFQSWDEQREVIDFAEIVQALKRIDLERADLAGALIFANRTYRRIAIRRRDHYEAMVLCWKSGQRSPIHNHAGSSCVVRVVEGRATETRFVSSACGRLVPQWSRSFPAGTVTGCRDGGMIHQMANLEPPGQELITLHVYSPPPLHWKYYSLDETTLADHDRIVREGTETVIVDFGQAVRSGRKGLGNGSFESVGWDEARPVIAIVGGGFSGAMVAVQLARQAGPNPPRVVLFEKTERLARGLAYGTQCDQHLLNVPAGLMSALPDEPTHFLNWLQNRDPSAQHGTFASRRVYGDYLEELLTSTAKASATRIDFVRDEVVDLEFDEGSRSANLLTRQGNRLAADKVVLALGHPMPQTPEGLDQPSVREGYVANPWSAGALDGLETDEPIVLIGTGLTAVDLIIEARAKGHEGVIYAVSRHGLLPCCHRTSPTTNITPTFRSRPRPNRPPEACCGACDPRSRAAMLREMTGGRWWTPFAPWRRQSGALSAPPNEPGSYATLPLAGTSIATESRLRSMRCSRPRDAMAPSSWSPGGSSRWSEDGPDRSRCQDTTPRSTDRGKSVGSPGHQLYRSGARRARRTFQPPALVDRARDRPPRSARARTGCCGLGSTHPTRRIRTRPDLRHRSIAQRTTMGNDSRARAAEPDRGTCSQSAGMPRGLLNVARAGEGEPLDEPNAQPGSSNG